MITPSPLSSGPVAVLRLMSCMEGFAHEEDGAAGRDDWPALARVLERELAVLTRLASERGAGGAEADAAREAELMARAEALHRRHAALGDRLARARADATAELAEIGATRRRMRSVGGAYATRPDFTGEARAA